MSTRVEEPSQRPAQLQQCPTHLNMPAPLTSQTLEIIRCEITKEMIAIIALHAKNVIPCTPSPAVAAGDQQQGATSVQYRAGSGERMPSPPTTPGPNTTSSVPPLDLFITNLVMKSRVQAGTLICTLVYLQRLRRRLPKEARGMECTCHRIFLATLIVAGKYLNDASPKNKYWARYSTVFTVAEVNLMEKQLLFLLDFDLRIDNNDLNEAAAAFIKTPSASAQPLTPTTPTFVSNNILEAAIPALQKSTSSQKKSSYAHSTQQQLYQNQKIDTAKASYQRLEGGKGISYPAVLGLGSQRQQSIAPLTMDSAIADSASNEIQDSKNIMLTHNRGRTQSVPSIDMRAKLSSSTSVSATTSSTAAAVVTTTAAYADSQGKGVPETEPTPFKSTLLTLRHTVFPKRTYVNNARVSTSLCLGSCKAEDASFHHISTAESAVPNPSPKKRAVSRGDHGNIPHPSPIYNHHATESQYAAEGSRSESHVTLSELADCKSHHRQYRYNCTNISSVEARRPAPGQYPRATSSVPFFCSTKARFKPANNSIESSDLYPPCDQLGKTPSSLSRCAIGCDLKRTARGNNKSQLRHQYTLPEIRIHPLPNQDSDQKDADTVASNTCTAQLCSTRSLSENHSLESTPVYLEMPVSTLVAPSLSRMAHEEYRNCQYTNDNSPVNTLVYDYSPAVAPSSTISRCNAKTNPLPPVSTHPFIANSQTANTIQLQFSTTTGGTGTGGSKEQSHNKNGMPSDSSTSGGWHLKNKILHPISTWFRSTRQSHAELPPPSYSLKRIDSVDSVEKRSSKVALNNPASSLLSSDSRMLCSVSPKYVLEYKAQKSGSDDSRTHY